jgi:hypothetical protein
VDGARFSRSTSARRRRATLIRIRSGSTRNTSAPAFFVLTYIRGGIPADEHDPESRRTAFHELNLQPVSSCIRKAGPARRASVPSYRNGLEAFTLRATEDHQFVPTNDGLWAG